jgi:hypothetical protein
MVRYLRYRRLLFSALCIVASIGQAVFWVRSYSSRTSAEVLVTPRHRFFVHSLDGAVVVHWEGRIFLGIELRPYHPESFYDDFPTQAGIRLAQDSRRFYAVSISYWLLTTVTLLASALPWLRWQFSHRTLLIAMTLSAAILSAAVVASR